MSNWNEEPTQVDSWNNSQPVGHGNDYATDRYAICASLTLSLANGMNSNQYNGGGGNV